MGFITLTVETCNICYTETFRYDLSPSIRLEMFAKDGRRAQYPIIRTLVDGIIIKVRQALFLTLD